MNRVLYWGFARNCVIKKKRGTGTTPISFFRVSEIYKDPSKTEMEVPYKIQQGEWIKAVSNI